MTILWYVSRSPPLCLISASLFADCLIDIELGEPCTLTDVCDYGGDNDDDSVRHAEREATNTVNRKTNLSPTASCRRVRKCDAHLPTVEHPGNVFSSAVFAFGKSNLAFKYPQWTDTDRPSCTQLSRPRSSLSEKQCFAACMSVRSSLSEVDANKHGR